MTILFVFGFPPRIGGHYKSGAAFAKGLRKIGHTAIAAAPEWSRAALETFSPTFEHLAAVPGLRYRRQIYRLMSFRDLRKLSLINQVDVINAMDFKSLSPSMATALSLNIGFVYTQAGGPVPRKQLPPSGVETVLFSRELYDGMKTHQEIDIEQLNVIRARIDTTIFRPETVKDDFVEKYHLPERGKKVAMAMRFSNEKRPWLNTALSLSDRLLSENPHVHVVLAGGGPLLDEIRRNVADINRRLRRDRAFHLTGPIDDPAEMNQLYNYADVVIGHGRGVLEAMSCGKPIMVLGEDRGGEIAEPCNVEEIAIHNFSGRHLRDRATDDRDAIANLVGLLQDSRRAAIIGEFCRNYISTEMDLSVAAEQLLNVYRRAKINGNRWGKLARWLCRHWR